MEQQHVSTAFEQLPRTVHNHFRLHFFAAVYHLLYYIYWLEQLGGEKLSDSLETYPFIKGYFREMLQYMPRNLAWDAGPQWWRREIQAWEHTIEFPLPLRRLDMVAGIDFSSRIALMLAGLMEEDSRFGTLIAQLQAPLPARRLCLETIGQILTQSRLSPQIDAWSICRPLVQTGLIELSNQDAPRAEWVLRVPHLLWDIARGRFESQPAPWCRVHQATDFAEISELVFPPAFLQHLARVPALVESGRTRALVLRGMQGSERLEVLGALARALGQGVIEVLPTGDPADFLERHCFILGTMAAMSNCIPVMSLDMAPGETLDLPEPAAHSSPLGILMGFEGGLKGPVAEKALTLTLPVPGFEQRLRHWQQVFERQPVPDLTLISERFHLPGGYIRRAGHMALLQAALNQRGTVTLEDVRTACRSLNRQLLDTLASHLEAAGSWPDLIVSELTAVRLRDLEMRCRHRERLLDHLGAGFRANRNRGVRALFTGSSGTGKTLAARILAAELGMDIYRVDLSAVVNKYIGETEKNLHRVLSRAEELDVVLLLDEGDALLGNRTEVKSSNDRYANLETNYLLQRLEHYQGIVLITTNAGQNIDTAFQRRIDVVVHFVPPDAAERLAIWHLHLPGCHALSDDWLEEVAVRCDLTGGQIRNAALNASLLALDAQSPLIEDGHLTAAIESEYRKAGAINPLAVRRNDQARSGGLEAFMNALS